MIDTQKHTEETIRPHIMKGAAWMVGMRWTLKGIGFVSTMFLARLLTPADFGLVAIAMLVVGFVEVFSDFGYKTAIIRHPDPTREHYNAAWTLGICINTVLGTLLLIAAPLGDILFHDPRAVLLIRILSVRLFINGFENIGTVDFRKHLTFHKDFNYTVAEKLITFVLMMSILYFVRNYWVLISGMVGSRFVVLILSYTMHSYRPKICFIKFKEIWLLSGWTLFYSVGLYFNTFVDQYFVGHFSSVHDMGQYTVISDVGETPTAELVTPLGRALLPTYAKLVHSPNELYKAFLNTLSVIAVFCCVAGVGVALIAPELIILFLGPQWVSASNIMVLISITAGIFTFSNTTASVLNATGDTKKMAIQNWVRISFIVLSLFITSFISPTPYHFAFVKMIATIIVMPFFFFNLKDVFPITFGDIFQLVWRPLISSIVMVFVVLCLPLTHQPFIDLWFKIGVGGVVFISTIMFLWVISGRPGTAEKLIVKFIGKIIRGLKVKVSTGSSRSSDV